MKRKLLWTASILLILGVVGLMAYWESFLAAALKSTLSSRFDLELKSEGLKFGLRGGRITFDQPSLFDKANDVMGRFVTASSLGIGLNVSQALRGRVDVKSINAEQMNVSLQHLPNGRLHMAEVIQRFTPQRGQTIAAASPASTTRTVEAESNAKKEALPTPAPIQSASPPQEVKVPIFDLTDSQFNYQDVKKVNYQILTQHVRVVPQADDITVEGGVAYHQNQPDRPVMSVDSLKILNLMLPHHQKVQVSAAGLNIETRLLDDNLFDAASSFHAWREVFIQISHTISPPRPGSPRTPKELETLTLDNVSALLLPKVGDENSPGAIRVIAEAIHIQGGNDLTLANVTVTEAGKDALQLKSLKFSGLKEGLAHLQTLQLQGVNMNLLENPDNSLNVNRAIEQIRTLIQSLFPPKERTAQAEPRKRFPDSLRMADLQDIHLTWLAPNQERRFLDLGRLQYDAANRLASLSDLSIKTSHEKAPAVKIGSLFAETQPDDILHNYQSMKIHNLFYQTYLKGDTVSFGAMLKAWGDLPERIAPNPNAPGGDEKEKKPYSINALLVQNSRAEIFDVTASREIAHRFDPVSIEWKNFVYGAEKPILGDMTLSAHILTPSVGEMQMQGFASPNLDLINLNLITRIRANDLKAYNEYFGKNQAIVVEKGGIILQGNNRIVDNHISAVFDMTLTNPMFRINEGSLPAQIENQTVKTAINGLRDSEGNIILRGNEISGNIKDPQLNFGAGILDILGRNLYNRIFNLPWLATDIAGKGAGMVGNTLKAIGEGVGGVINNIFGGESEKK